ncbi:hypothetical protein CEP53_014055 [Fusarium sp. AF-6]|nr:hypothetical protein CEP53_014055 [Fusarium sp. AF-6]
MPSRPISSWDHKANAQQSRATKLKGLCLVPAEWQVELLTYMLAWRPVLPHYPYSDMRYRHRYIIQTKTI